MNDLDEKITKLETIWYNLACPGHYKDDDCHFYITIDYCYCGEIRYLIEHDGYISGRWSERVDSLDAAKRVLVSRLVSMIKKQIDCALKASKICGDGERLKITKRCQDELDKILDLERKNVIEKEK